MSKAPEAFRTISEVAELLETPAHVLRFWESRFPQIKPVKRAGGRRYYRPADVALLSGIRHLLHAGGMTIRGVQKVLREQGVRHVAGLTGDISDLDLDAEDFDDPAAEPTFEGAEILALAPMPRRGPQVGGLGAEVQPLFPKPEPDMGGTDLAGTNLAETDRVAGPALAPEPPDRKAPPDHAPTPLTGVPRDGEGGFIAFSNATPRSKPPVAKPLSTQATLPFDAPEAPHVWVEADDDAAFVAPHVFAQTKPDSAAPALDALLLTPAVPVADPTPPNPTALTDPAPASSPAALTDALALDTQLADAKMGAPLAPTFPDDPPALAGLAARLRALPGPVLPTTGASLGELHSRLGLLHAQMAEALRLRR